MDLNKIISRIATDSGIDQAVITDRIRQRQPRKRSGRQQAAERPLHTTAESLQALPTYSAHTFTKIAKNRLH